MGSFTPNSTIYACATGIDDHNKPYFTSNSSAASYCTSRQVAAWSNYSYQRADERQYCAVEATMSELAGVDTLVWYNSGNDNRWIIANVVNLEFKNPNVVWIWFKVDAFMTYCGNIQWANSYCFVEREHVNADWSGSTPQFSTCGVDEPVSITPTRILYAATEYQASGGLIFIVSPYDTSGSPTIGGRLVGRTYTGLNLYMFTSSENANTYLTNIAESDEADIANVVSAFTLPSSFNGDPDSTTADNQPWNVYTTIYNAKCFTSQYCVLRANSMIGGTKDYAPELFNDPNNITFWNYRYILPSGGGWIAYPANYAGGGYYTDYFSITEFPSGVVCGDAYAQWVALNGFHTVASAVNRSIGSVGQGLVGGAMSALSPDPISKIGMVGNILNAGTDVVQNALDAAQSFKDAKAHGVELLGAANTNANLAAACGAYGYSLDWIIPQARELYALDDYFSRFGYQVNRLKIPNRNNRSHWNYIKCGEAHVAGNMPYSYRTEINNMLLHGVTFWHNDTTIGDFSDKSGNSTRG